jgi:FkbM family methyltransferase
MREKINIFLRKIGFFNSLKMFKDRFFENPGQVKHKEKLYKFYSEFIRKGDLCFDIGASYGNRTETFLKLGAKVVSIEPQASPAAFLKNKFGDQIILKKKALGQKKETRRMYSNNGLAINSLSMDWIQEVTKSKRYGDHKWDKYTNVEVTTLDHLIQEYGKPDFCKIDVEGYELEVLKGLTAPIPYLSFEFTIPEFLSRAIECLAYLNSMGTILCNYSSGETLEFGLKDWLNFNEFGQFFKTLSQKDITDGDIYVKFINNFSK